MLPLLLLSNLRLVVYLFGALVFAAMSWLYFDALFVRPHKSVLLRAVGALLLALSYLFGAVLIEGTEHAWVSIFSSVVGWIRIAGYLILATGVWGEPLSERPRLAVVVGTLPSWILPILPGFVGLGYLRRASVGLERHLKGMAYGMYVLTLAEILDMRRLFVATADIRIYELVRDYGSIWIAQVVTLLIGLVMVSKWVFSYLLRRFETQITLFMGMLVMSVFAMATLSFTYVMVNRLEQGAKSLVASGGKMTLNSWERSGSEAVELARKYSSAYTKDKEVLASEIKEEKYQVVVVGSDRRDVVTGELWAEYPVVAVAENKKEATGYQIMGEGSGRRVVYMAASMSPQGGAISMRDVSGEILESASSETGMAIRIINEGVVIESSSVPGHPDIASTLGLTRTKPGKLGGVEYIEAEREIKNAEGVVVATLITANPMSDLWREVSYAILITYLVGIGILIIMELPAVMMSKYLTRQLR